jgi:hypothetical protein
LWSDTSRMAIIAEFHGNKSTGRLRISPMGDLTRTGTELPIVGKHVKWEKLLFSHGRTRFLPWERLF